jgi:Cu+-exporting ATPase
MPDSATLDISGMTCAACSARVERALKQAPGVSAAHVNLMTATATVGFDPTATSPARLAEVVPELVARSCPGRDAKKSWISRMPPGPMS